MFLRRIPTYNKEVLVYTNLMRDQEIRNNNDVRLVMHNGERYFFFLKRV